MKQANVIVVSLAVTWPSTICRGGHSCMHLWLKESFSHSYIHLWLIDSFSHSCISHSCRSPVVTCVTAFSGFKNKPKTCTLSFNFYLTETRRQMYDCRRCRVIRKPKMRVLGQISKSYLYHMIILRWGLRRQTTLGIEDTSHSVAGRPSRALARGYFGRSFFRSSSCPSSEFCLLR
eukprot:sb/3471902/